LQKQAGGWNVGGLSFSEVVFFLLRRDFLACEMMAIAEVGSDSGVNKSACLNVFLLVLCCVGGVVVLWFVRLIVVFGVKNVMMLWVLRFSCCLAYLIPALTNLSVR
jgi:hypothetical protein